jgi:hypothetical protein
MKIREFLKNYSKMGMIISGIVLVTVCVVLSTSEPVPSDAKDTV